MVSIFFLLLLFILFKCAQSFSHFSIQDFGILRNDKVLLKEFCFLKLINKPRYFVLFLQLIGTINSEKRMTYRSSACMLIDTNPNESWTWTSDAVLCSVPIRFMISSELISTLLTFLSQNRLGRYTSPLMERFDYWLASSVYQNPRKSQLMIVCTNILFNIRKINSLY